MPPCLQPPAHPLTSTLRGVPFADSPAARLQTVAHGCTCERSFAECFCGACVWPGALPPRPGVAHESRRRAGDA
eukprot:2728816-Pleurochrysis_carterae.AAC.1